MKSLRLTLFGVFRVHDSVGQKVEIAGTKARLLLAYLSLQSGRPQSREKIMGLFWSQRSEGQARGSLRQALWAIRRALENIEPNPLVTEGDAVALDPGFIDVDVVNFEGLLADGSPDSLQSALELYGGEFLEGARIRDPVFEDLLRSERLRLHGLAVDACTRLLENQVQAGMKRAAMTTAKRLLMIDSSQETAHRTLMAYYADTGQLGLAKKQYQTCCENLKRELDVAPDTETKQLFSRIRLARPAATEPSTYGDQQIDLLTGHRHAGDELIYTQATETSIRGASADDQSATVARLRCPRCQLENTANQKFCGACGKSLTSICSNCAATNPSNQNYCGECGVPLNQSIAPPKFTSPEGYTPKHHKVRILTYKDALDGERKRVTVVFAELLGSMKLVANLDPEDARKILDPLLEAMIETVQRYDGSVTKVLGDGVTALFGAPLAHEDHAVRACYAALAMREAILDAAMELKRTQQLEPKVRIGINSGEIVVGGINKNLTSWAS